MNPNAARCMWNGFRSVLSSFPPHDIVAETMARVLRGVVVKDGQGVLGNLVAGKPEAVRAFRDEDVEFLMPLLVEGLTQSCAGPADWISRRQNRRANPIAIRRAGLLLV